MSEQRIIAHYLIETAIDPYQAVEAMAGEQSSGTFVALPGETPEVKFRHGARIERLDPLEEAASPGLPGAISGSSYHRAKATLSWPMDNLGPSLPNLAATIAGNLFELKQFSGLRILDVELPNEFGRTYLGPQFGIGGTRQFAGVKAGPLIGTIIKPSVGLSPQETAEMVEALCQGGIDFVKDDELQSDGTHCPFDERVRAVMAKVNAHADRTGKKVMVAFNVTGDLDQMRRRHDLVAELGGTCVMASLNSVGLVGMIELRRMAQLPIHGHRNGWGYLSRHPLLGWSFPAWSKLWRLAGADHLHVNGIRNKFCEDDTSVITSARSLLTPLFPDQPMTAMPVFSSGQTAATVADTYQALGTTDLIFAAGGGIMGHPDGIATGVQAIRNAWELACA